jgi:hypothetical protein
MYSWRFLKLSDSRHANKTRRCQGESGEQFFCSAFPRIGHDLACQ